MSGQSTKSNTMIETEATMSAFRMRLKPGAKAAYIAAHQRIWPELAALLRASGISDYRIFLDPNGIDLFAVRRTGDAFDENTLADDPIMQRWWQMMVPLMEFGVDGSPATSPLTQVFHLA